MNLISDDKFKRSSCPICAALSAGALEYLRPFHTTAPQLKDLRIEICNHCGFGFATPFRSIQEMGDFYANHYRAPGAQHKFHALKSARRQPSLRCLSQWLLVLPFIDRSKIVSVLEIGAGGAASVEMSRLLGVSSNYSAVEPDKFSATDLRKARVEVIEDSFHSNTQIPEASYDMVLLSHVLEHYAGSELSGIIGKLHLILKSKGMILVEVPNCPMGDFGVDRLSDSPHLSFFTRESLARLLSDNGFEILVCTECGQDYKSWWQAQKPLADIVLGRGARGKVRDIARTYLKPLVTLVAMLRECNRMIRTRLASTPGLFDVMNSSQFRYANGGLFIRVLARKKSS